MESFNPLSAGSGYLAARPATQPIQTEAPGQHPLNAAASDFTEILRETEATAEATLVNGSDPHVLVEALAQSKVAVEAAVTIRNKVVEAYREILRMPV